MDVHFLRVDFPWRADRDPGKLALVLLVADFIQGGDKVVQIVRAWPLPLFRQLPFIIHKGILHVGSANVKN